MQNGIYSYPGTSRIIYGIDFAEALADELALVGAQKVFVLASGTLARNTSLIERLRQVLGARFVGLCAKIGAHTPRTDVVAAAIAARAARADMLLTLGGGSVTDAAKMVSICLGNDISDPSQLDAYRITVRPDGSWEQPSCNPPSVSSVVIPTTLTAAEFKASAGCTDTLRQIKEMFIQPAAIPRTVIFDPAVTVHTPDWLWLSTGIRAVDHAVEDLCSINSKPLSEATSFHALRLLGAGLRATKNEPDNLDARLDCQLGAWMSMIGSAAGVMKGASHGIGHVLGGAANVPHGYTSCVMLPHVMRFNYPVNAERQKRVSEALGHPDQAAADLLASLIADLGLPGTLRAVGLKADMLDRIAADSMHDRMVRSNPRKIDSPAIVRQLLDAAW